MKRATIARGRSGRDFWTRTRINSRRETLQRRLYRRSTAVASFVDTFQRRRTTMLPGVAGLLSLAVAFASAESILTTEVFVIPIRPETFDWSSGDGKTLGGKTNNLRVVGSRVSAAEIIRLLWEEVRTEITGRDDESNTVNSRCTIATRDREKLSNGASDSTS